MIDLLVVVGSGLVSSDNVTGYERWTGDQMGLFVASERWDVLFFPSVGSDIVM
jgi:hypothetical protein